MFKVFSRYMRKHVDGKVTQKKEKIEYGSKKRRSYCYCFSDKSFFPDYFKKVNKRFGNCRRTLVGIKENDKEKGTDDTFKTEAYLRNPWIEAIGWSGTLVFGWALSQNIHLYLRRQNLRDCISSHKFDNSGIHKHLCPHHILKNIVVNNVLTQPNDFVDVKSLLSSENVSVSQTSLPVIGPKTADQALNDATDGVKKVRNEAVGELENRLGLRCMSKQRYRKAVIHFAAGSALQNSSATFNLAQCYELGLGTEQDYEKAAKCYRTASDQGNASATYNLAVFYAHGYGGLKTDRSKALQLLRKAVTLGEPNAKQLLERYVLTKTHTSTEKENDTKIIVKEKSHNESTKEVIPLGVKSNFKPLRLSSLQIKSDMLKNDKVERSADSSSVSTDDGLVSGYESSNSSLSSSDSSCGSNPKTNDDRGKELNQRLSSDESSFSVSLPCRNSRTLKNQKSTDFEFGYPVPFLVNMYKLATASSPGS